MNVLDHVDAFTDGERPFSGNPAAICLLDDERDDAWKQSLAAEIGLSETAFLRHRPDHDWDLRWFTPTVEVDLCGHATLASAHCLWRRGLHAADRAITFHTRSGALTATPTPPGEVVKPAHELITIDLPALQTEPAAEAGADLAAALGCQPVAAVGSQPMAAWRSRFDLLVEVADAEAVRNLTPDHDRIRALGVRGVCVTAKGDGGYDIISRFFAPGSGIDEDPVTGSAHCVLGPFWAARLGKNELRAWQASPRGGELMVRVDGERVHLAGRAVTVLAGELLY